MKSSRKLWVTAALVGFLLGAVPVNVFGASPDDKTAADKNQPATKMSPRTDPYWVPNSTHPAWMGAGPSIDKATSHVDGLVGNAVAGREHYRRYCIGCHGPVGNGEGENAQWIDPKPRDFTEGTFRCRSTPTGELPTDQDLFNTLGRGFVTTNMPSWLPLSDQNKVDLIAYIKIFSAKWNNPSKAAPIQIPAETPITVQSIERGHDDFEKMQCFKCHGQQGHGDGPSASTLTNSKDQPIRPYDFASGERFKCGSTNADIYRDFMTGLDGSPMPSFADQLKPDEAWDLVHYLRTLMVHLDSPERRLMIQNHLQFKNEDSGQ
jgi:mono/diheme cytochrome c family protein